MKKKLVCNSIIIFLTIALWFLPTQGKNIYVSWWVSTVSTLFTSKIYFILHSPRELLIVMFGCVEIMILVIDIIKRVKVTKLLSIIAILSYCTSWIIVIFVPSPYFTIFEECKYGYLHPLWIVLYLTLLLTIVILTVVQYLSPRSPTKVERMQAQIDDLQKQVDELKKGE